MRATKIVRTGTFPTALYGAEVVGVPDTKLLSLRRSAAAAAIPKARGRSLDVTLACSRLEVTKEATAAPIILFAKEIWQSAGCYVNAFGALFPACHPILEHCDHS